MDNLSSQPKPKPTHDPKVLWILISIAIGLVIAPLSLMVFMAIPRNTLVSDSPNGKHRIMVREGKRFIDRNFQVVLVDQQTDTERVIFISDDQSPTITQERFIWTDDSSKVVLVGDSRTGSAGRISPLLIWLLPPCHTQLIYIAPLAAPLNAQILLSLI